MAIYKYMEHPSQRQEEVQKPEISIVIPAFNEEKLLPYALESISKAIQHTRTASELIIVDNASTDSTPKIAEQFGAKVIVEERKGVGYARQAGLLEAQGDIVLTSDADGTQVPEEWINRHMQHYSTPEVVAVSGKYEFFDSKHPVIHLYDIGSDIWHRTIRNMVHRMRGLDPNKYNKKFAGSNMSYRRKIALHVGGYREGVNASEDTDLGRRLEDVGSVVRDESPQMTIRTTARRFQRTEDVLPFLTHRVHTLFERYVLGVEKSKIDEGTMKDIR